LTSTEATVDQAGAWIWDQDHAACYQVGEVLLTGERVRTAKYEFGSDDCPQAASAHCVSVQFRGDDFVEKVATPFVGQQVAIVLDNEVVSAPTINQGITGREVVITGDFSEGEAKDLALVLRYGSLPVKFDERQTVISNVSPSLGKDQLRAGIIAGSIGLALVGVYMFAYYRVLGLVVLFCLGLTGLIMFSLVSLLGDSQNLTLTLSGVTGLIVSVGVTVDSYVVYFERLKDEVRTGKTIRSSLDVGFQRAFRTIVAGDLVSLIGAAVLYLLAIGSVKGFAYFLGLSTAVDLLISYFVMHPLVSVMARRESLVRMRGIGIAKGLDVAPEGAL
jgi:preprotein translocase subunit SecD